MTAAEEQTKEPTEAIAMLSVVPQKSQKRGPCRNVLFLCSDNAIASIMAEALLRKFGKHSFPAISAGSKPSSRVHLLTTEALKGRKVWQPDLHPKSFREFLDS